MRYRWALRHMDQAGSQAANKSTHWGVNMQTHSRNIDLTPFPGFIIHLTVYPNT